jgi:hypothetical protein
VSNYEAYVPIDDLAEVLNIKTQTLRTWVRQGHIPKETYIRVANTYRFNIPQVLKALTEQNAEQSNTFEASTQGATGSVSTVTVSTTDKIEDSSLPSLEELGLDLDENEDF